MRVLLQRVREAKVSVGGREIASIERGYLALLGVAEGDSEAELEWLAQKILKMRLFPDDAGKMNLSLLEVGGAILMVSQFTLLADTKKGNRPSFIGAARPEQGKAFYLKMIARPRELGVSVGEGEFGADMQVALVNDGPVTIWIDSRDKA